MLREIRVHDALGARIGFDGGEEGCFFVVVVRVHHLVEALAVDEEIGDVGGGGDLAVLEGDGVQGSEYEVVCKGHAGCNFDCVLRGLGSR